MALLLVVGCGAEPLPPDDPVFPPGGAPWERTTLLPEVDLDRLARTLAMDTAPPFLLDGSLPGPRGLYLGGKWRKNGRLMLGPATFSDGLEILNIVQVCEGEIILVKVSRGYVAAPEVLSYAAKAMYHASDPRAAAAATERLWRTFFDAHAAAFPSAIVETSARCVNGGRELQDGLVCTTWAIRGGGECGAGGSSPGSGEIEPRGVP